MSLKHHDRKPLCTRASRHTQLLGSAHPTEMVSCPLPLPGMLAGSPGHMMGPPGALAYPEPRPRV